MSTSLCAFVHTPTVKFLCVIHQMCGAGLLGWQKRGPGTHHYSWQGHVHGHPVQGERTHNRKVHAALFTATSSGLRPVSSISVYTSPIPLPSSYLTCEQRRRGRGTRRKKSGQHAL